MKICSVGRWYYAQQTIQTCNAALLRDKSKPQCYPFYLAFTWNNCDIVMLGTLRCSRTSSYSPYLQIGHIRILAVGLELPCNGGSCGGISLKIDECNLHLKRLPCISLTCKLVPVQYREYEYGLFSTVSRQKLSRSLSIFVFVLYFRLPLFHFKVSVYVSCLRLLPFIEARPPITHVFIDQGNRYMVGMKIV